MADLTLPGDIPGLLRRGSPLAGGWTVARAGTKVIAVANRDGMLWGESPKHYSLDLSDPTGRAHAWAYLSDNGGTLWWGDAAEALGLDADLIDRAVHHAMRWVDMTPGEIDILRRVVLHVAGREVTHG